MSCIICGDWSSDPVECDFCEGNLCEDCIIDGDGGETFCSTECQVEFYVN